MPKFDPQKHHRRSIRLKNYDYSQAGGYFVTMVTWQREFLFGEVVNGEMKLNQHGNIVNECWHEIPEHFANVELGAFIVMPNHVHGIIFIIENRNATNLSHSVGARQSATKWYASPLPPKGVTPNSLGAIVGSFKSAVTKRIGRELNETGIWQRNYASRVLCGVTNTSSATIKIYKTKRITLRQIHCCGNKMTKTQSI